MESSKVSRMKLRLFIRGHADTRTRGLVALYTHGLADSRTRCFVHTRTRGLADLQTRGLADSLLCTHAPSLLYTLALFAVSCHRYGIYILVHGGWSRW